MVSMITERNLVLFPKLIRYFSGLFNLFPRLDSNQQLCPKKIPPKQTRTLHVILIFWNAVILLLLSCTFSFKGVTYVDECSLNTYTQAKSPRVNFTWNEFHVNFTWNFHMNFTWNLFHVNFTWNCHVNFTWNSFHVKFMWNISRELQVNRVSHEIHVKYTPIFHVNFVSRNLFKSFNFR